MRGDGFGIFGDLSKVRGVPGEVLRDLIAPWARQCAGHGLDLSQVADEGLALGLVRLLGLGRRALPPGLVDALDRIEDLADDEGFDAILTRLETAGRPVDWAGGTLGPLRLAVQAWVSAHDRFEEAEVTRDVGRAGSMREYPAADGSAMSLEEPDRAAERLQSRMAGYWRERGRSPWCKVLVFQDNGRVYMPFHRGEAWRTEAALVGDEPSAVSFRPRGVDLAAFDERTGRLMLKTRDPSARREYLAQIGEALFGDAEALRERPVVSLEPLVRLGRAALAPTPGLKEVEFVDAKLALHGKRPTTITIASPDVLDSMAEHGLPEFAAGTLMSVRLLLRFQTGRRRKLELRPPNEIAFDRRKNEHVVLRFLEERGFVAPPGGTQDEPTPPTPRTAQLGIWG